MSEKSNKKKKCYRTLNISNKKLNITTDREESIFNKILLLLTLYQ